ncbi:MAG: hypothetical protein PHU85_03425 [Phycisphaerae bacterium]|nr:hypothetical protein [Phycisphaerae bacterium]
MHTPPAPSPRMEPFEPRLMLSGGPDFSADINWIYYNDALGRSVDWNPGVTAAAMDAGGTVALPNAAASSTAASETSAAFVFEAGSGLQAQSLAGGVYSLSVQQSAATPPTIATLDATTDGSPTEWDSASLYISDAVGDFTDVPGTDIAAMHVAYSTDGSRLNFLFQLDSSPDPLAHYQIFLDKNLDGEAWNIGDFGIDIHFDGSTWVANSYAWTSSNGWDTSPVPANPVVAVSGNYIELAADTAEFELPGDVNIFAWAWGQTPRYIPRDQVATGYKETEGWASLNAAGLSAGPADQFTWAARLGNFANYSGSGTNHGFELNSGDDGPALVTADFGGEWYTGTHNGVAYTNVLALWAQVESDNPSTPFEWSSDGGGLPMLITGLDPATAVVDLKIVVTAAGQTAQFYYRVNSVSPDVGGADWQLLDSLTLPGGVGSMVSLSGNFPAVVLTTDTSPDTVAPDVIDGLWQIHGANGFGAVIANGAGGIVGGGLANNDGTSDTFAGGGYEIYPDRTVGVELDKSGGGEDSLIGAINAAGDVMALTDANRPTFGGQAGFGLAVNSAGTFATSDLVGTWTVTFPGATGTLTFDARGRVTGSLAATSGQRGRLTNGTWTLDSGGLVTATLHTSIPGLATLGVVGRMNASKDLVAFNVLPFWDPSAKTNLGVLTRHAGRSSVADLAGKWNVVSTGVNATLLFDGAGQIIGGGGIDSEHNSFTITGGTYTVGADGKTTVAFQELGVGGTDTRDFVGLLNAGRNTLVLTDRIAGPGAVDNIVVAMAPVGVDVGVTLSYLPPASLLPGDKLVLPVTISNEGGTTAAGPAGLHIWLGTSSVPDPGNDILIADLPQQLLLGAGQDLNLNVPVGVPMIHPGSYFVHVELVANGIGDSNPSNNAASSASPLGVVWPIGQFGGRKLASATYRDPDGTFVTFAFKGPGYGFVDVDGSYLSVDLFNTTLATSVTVTTRDSGLPADDGEATFSAITVNGGSLGTFFSKVSDLAGDVYVEGRLGTLVLEDVDDVSSVTIDDSIFTALGRSRRLGSPGPAYVGASLRFDDVFDLGITSNVPIISLMATQFINGPESGLRIQAPTIGVLTITGRGPIKGRPSRPVVAGDFSADVELTGAGPTGNSLGMALIAGRVFYTTIRTYGGIGGFLCGAIHDSLIFAGVDTGPGDPMPSSSADFYNAATIDYFWIAGMSAYPTSGFANSKVAAARINDITVRDVLTTASTPFGFGFAADESPIIRYRRFVGKTQVANLSNVTASLAPDLFFRVLIV